MSYLRTPNQVHANYVYSMQISRFNLARRLAFGFENRLVFIEVRNFLSEERNGPGTLASALRIRLTAMVGTTRRRDRVAAGLETRAASDPR